MFRVGQKVVCVDADNFRNPHLGYLTDFKFPVQDGIYTVRGFTSEGHLRLDEITGRPHHWVLGFYEGGWRSDRFRPIVETEISFAHEILRKASRRVEA